jgi:hypothetical protein
VTFSNSVIYNEDVPLNARVISGIAIEMVDGGWVEGVVVSNIRMQRVRTPIFIRLGNRGGGQRTPTPGRLRGVSINNLHATGAILTSSITGLPGHDIEDVALTDIRIETEEGGKAAWIGDVPELPASYPEARMFGRLPAWGLYCRHVRDLKLDNIRLAAAAPDERPAIHCEDAKELRVDRIEATASASSQPLIRLVNVQGGLLTGCAAPVGAAVAVEISGATAAEIRAVGNDFSRAQRAFEFQDGAQANALTEADNLLPKQ